MVPVKNKERKPRSAKRLAVEQLEVSFGGAETPEPRGTGKRMPAIPRPAKTEPKPAAAPRRETSAAEAPPAAPRVGRKKEVRTSRSAAELATRQREISVSEFFAKNRHLLGFDNPSKALLTTVKEAVDNSLDACEEAGILPDLQVEIAPSGGGSLPRRGPGQRPRDRAEPGAEDLRPAALRVEVPHPEAESRGQQGIGISAAGMYGLLTTRQAGGHHLAHRREATRPTTSSWRSTPRRTSRRS